MKAAEGKEKDHDVEPNDGPEEGQIRAVLYDRIAALRAKDAARFLSHFEDGFVNYELGPPLQYSAEDKHSIAGLDQWFASFKGPVSYEMHDLKISAGSDVGYCHSLYRIAGQRADGEPLDLWTRQTLGLRKIDGKWKIGHSHMSVPFHMDGSERAALDLTP